MNRTKQSSMPSRGEADRQQASGVRREPSEQAREDARRERQQTELSGKSPTSGSGNSLGSGTSQAKGRS
ncbi:hypothetical protein QF025_006210 [Paraburkholderia graminis]|jgi:hypothetical protein|uniref:Uncharacterized protein n=1 Tax=Paraburkholderia graminis TaxID=60548 RepID=A0ABD5CQI4_9BURK|nr:hypothetical protein [Paraburkholderia graminis]